MIALALLLAACVPANPASERILAGDLAQPVPAFAGIAPQTVVGLAPAPGVRRVFRQPELRALASRLHLATVPEGEICVERPVAAPDPARLLEAMRQSLPGATIAIVDFSRQALPDGNLEFPAAGLHTTPGGAIWDGYVAYGGGTRFRTWAKVEVRVHTVRVVAAADLRAGSLIGADQLRVEEADAFPSPETFAERVEQVAGRVSSRPIRAGTAVALRYTADPPLVTRGQTVRVEVQSGAARLVLEAEAEASGSLGDRITVRNTENNRRFRARVEGKGTVSTSPAEGARMQPDAPAAGAGPEGKQRTASASGASREGKP